MLQVKAKIGTTIIRGFAAVMAGIVGMGAIAIANSANATLNSITIIGTVVSLLIGALLCKWVIGGIDEQLSAAVAAGRRMAKGDLSEPISVDCAKDLDELVKALSEINEQMFKVVANIRLGTTAVAAVTGYIASDNSSLSARTESQASALEETASSMEELTSAVKQNADNAHHAAELVTVATSAADNGKKTISRVNDTMDAIKASSRKISEIIAAIDGIAFQTNILALNAAVEAARAGEQGRGFAVVAAEVRTLARHSSAAAQEIKSLILDSVQKVELGGHQVESAELAMAGIVSDIQRVAAIMDELAQASKEQSDGIEGVNQAIIQLDGMTQKNAQLVEGATSTAVSLQEQAVQLSEVVSIFNLGAREFGNAVEAESIVKDVIDYMNTHGLQATVDEVNMLTRGRFIDRDLYAVIYSFEGKLIAHGANQRLWGADWREIRDLDGKYFNREMAKILERQNSGWTEYKWTHPLTKATLTKKAFFQKNGDVFVACGFYKQ